MPGGSRASFGYQVRRGASTAVVLESAREAASQNVEPHSRKMPLPAAGVVPYAETAKKIAQAVWDRGIQSPAEGTKATDAELRSGVWIVTGSHTINGEIVTLAAFIQLEDGKILRTTTSFPGRS